MHLTMASEYETFWQMNRYAVVGHSKLHAFPRLTYGGLKRNGKLVYPIDQSADLIEGDHAYKSFEELPEPVDAVVLEVPKDETLDWCKRAIAHGIKDIWMHQGTDTPEAIAYANEHGARLRKGTCGVMYLSHGFSPHTIHGFINRVLGKY